MLPLLFFVLLFPFSLLALTIPSARRAIAASFTRAPQARSHKARD